MIFFLKRNNRRYPMVKNIIPASIISENKIPVQWQPGRQMGVSWSCVRRPLVTWSLGVCWPSSPWRFPGDAALPVAATHKPCYPTKCSGGLAREGRSKGREERFFLISSMRKGEFHCENINSSVAIHVARFLESNYFLQCFSEKCLQDWNVHSIWLTCVYTYSFVAVFELSG